MTNSAVSAPIRTVLVEDHAGTRAEIVASITEFGDRVRLLDAFGDAESLLRAPVLAAADVALVDLGLPRMSGAELIRRLADAHPHVRVVALTVFQDERNVLEALSSGAHGYIIKDEPIERLVSAIEEAASGEHPISSRVVGFLISQMRKAPPPVTLTFREQELASALAEGLSYAECGTRMAIALGTVQSHVKSLYRKLEVSSRAEVRAWVRRYHG